MSSKPDHPEIGRALKSQEIETNSVVMVGREDRHHFITTWVVEVS